VSIALLAALPSLLCHQRLLAADQSLPEIKVSSVISEIESPIGPQAGSNTATKISTTGIAASVNPGGGNSLKLIQLAPSVNVESADAYGTTLNQTIRIRGKSAFHLSRSIEGLPLAVLVGGGEILDAENLGEITVYRGAVPPNKGLSFSNAGGVVDVELRKPNMNAGTQGTLSIGSNNLRRAFARVDSGHLNNGSSSFLSASYVASDKWRGAGDSGKRNNLTMGWQNELSNGAHVEGFAVYNFQQQHDYRNLSYAQANNLNSYQSFDFNTQRSGNGTTDINYYDYNRQQYQDVALFGKLTLPLAEGNLMVKPYYMNVDGYRLYGGTVLGSAGVTRWDIKHDLYGGVAEYAKSYGTTQLTAGYWLQSMASPPPPVYQKAYRVQADGSLTFAGWSVLSQQERHIINSPYVMASAETGAWHWKGGVRYLNQQVPAITYMNSTGIPDTSYDNAISLSPGAIAGRATTRRDLSVWLPYLGTEVAIDSHWSAHSGLGRTYGRPDWGPQATQYSNNSAAFTKAGMNLQTLFDKLNLELNTTLDLGFNYQIDALSVAPTIYFGTGENREIQIYDPIAKTAYYQSNSHTNTRGVEVEVNYAKSDSLTLYSALSYNSQRFSENTQVSSSSTLATSGKQTPDTPEWMLKLAASLRYAEIEWSPSLRYIGERYGDALNTERVSAATVVDLNANLTPFHLANGSEVRVGMSVLNVFDRLYIANINASDIQANGSTTYTTGAPRTLALTASGKF